MKEIFDYFSGEIDAKAFLSSAKNNFYIAQWFQALIPSGADVIDIPYIPFHMKNGQGVSQRAKSSHPFWERVVCSTFLNIMGDRVDFLKFFKKTDAGRNAGTRLNLYVFLLTLAKTRYTNIQETKRYEDEFDFYLDICAERYESDETQDFLDRMIMEVYFGEGTLTARRKRARLCIKNAFHIDENHYPIWIHGPLWPMGEKSPMKYISTKKAADRKIFLFRDVDTQEERLVEEFF